MIEVPEDLAPLILFARYPEEDLLSVNVRGEGFRRLEEGQQGAFLFDGPGSSETATPGISQGAYELSVKGTKGPWTVGFTGTNPGATTVELPDALQGEGDVVGKVHLQEAAALEWEMASDGPFLRGHLMGYGEAEGAEQFLGIVQGGLIFEPGKNGLRTDDTLPAGDYLLIVDADGRWGYEFTRAQ